MNGQTSQIPVADVGNVAERDVDSVATCGMIPGMAYQIVMHELAIEELESVRAFEQRRVVAEIRQQLTHEPAVPSRNRKCLVDLTPSFEHELPIWELRVGNLRVFSDVNQADRSVHVRAMRRKDTQATEDIA